MHTKPISPWKQALQLGLLGGAIAVLLSLVGMVVRPSVNATLWTDGSPWGRCFSWLPSYFLVIPV